MNDLAITRRKPLAGEFFSAKYFFVRALVLVALFLVAHLLGLREYTTFLSGTTGNPAVSMETSSLYGLIYILLYLGCVVLAPILALSAAFLMLWQKLRRSAGS
jgi:hypothetical protein